MAPFAFLRPHRGLLALSLLLAVVAAALELLPHGLVYVAATDVLADPPRLDRLGWLGLVAFGGVALRYVLLGSSLLMSHAVAFRVLAALRRSMVDRLAHVGPAYFDAHSPGQLKKSLVEDVDALEGAVAHQLPDATSAIVVPVLGFAALCWVDWRMAVASVALVPVGLLLMGLAMRGMDDEIASWHAAESRANEAILEFLRGIVVLKAHDRDASSLARVRDGILGIRDLASAMVVRTSWSYSLFFTLLSSNLVVVLPVGLALHRSGALATPELVLFLLLGFGLTSALLKLMFAFGDLQMNQHRLERISRVLQAEAEGSPASARPASASSAVAVRLSNVTFAYGDDREPALRTVSFEAHPRRITALVGPSGAGKSTVARLIQGLRTPSSGSVQVSGSVASVSQHTMLFHRSLLDNLRMGRPDAPLDEVEAVVRAAHLEGLVASLPQGWDTLVGERGATLSGGEAQRVAIARALLLDRPILVLDEVTAHLDASSERLVQRALATLVRDRTVVVIAHRLRTVCTADQLVVLDQGRVVGTGQHDSLLADCPTYARLWNSQEQARHWRLAATEAPVVQEVTP